MTKVLVSNIYKRQKDMWDSYRSKPDVGKKTVTPQKENSSKEKQRTLAL